MKEVNLPEIFSIVDRTKGVLSDAEQDLLKTMASTCAFLQEAIKNKNISISRLQQILFGANTERTSFSGQLLV